MPITSFLANFSRTPTILLCNTMNSLEAMKRYNRDNFDRLIDSVKTFVSANRLNRFVYLGATLSETSVMRRSGFEAVYVNHNSFINYAGIAILEVKKQYDAIYNAQLSPFKRHHLAKRVDSLALLYGLWGNEEQKLSQFEEVYAVLPNAFYLNGGLGKDFEERPYQYLSRAIINQHLCEAHCGLCLSEREGAMYASFEYLLAGIPVVTTPSFGGRDALFPQDFTRFADSHENAVREAVASMVRTQVPAIEVRSEAIRIADRHRDRFREVLDRVCRSAGGDEIFDAYGRQLEETPTGVIAVPAHALKVNLEIQR
jgi:hypothetical protein